MNPTKLFFLFFLFSVSVVSSQVCPPGFMKIKVLKYSNDEPITDSVLLKMVTVTLSDSLVVHYLPDQDGNYKVLT
ncbi:MAG: hypothetical protein K0S33_123 [Bacteroidetes bacterium]|jgi:hypothetical protein|nr:hypothetical protein [Bacteroidota bacterium]